METFFHSGLAFMDSIGAAHGSGPPDTLSASGKRFFEFLQPKRFH
jgi:hypothetical protein